MSDWEQDDEPAGTGAGAGVEEDWEKDDVPASAAAPLPILNRKDSWDNDDGAVKPAWQQVQTTSVSWEDEDEVVNELKPAVAVPRKLSPAEEQEKLRKQQEEEKKLQARVEARRQMEETEDERRERLQKEVEESEIGIAAEMFAVKAKPESQAKSSGSIASGTVATAALQTKKDHETFARVVAERLDASTPLQLHAFMKESTTRLANKLTLDQVTELVEQLEKVRVKKAEAEGPVHSASKATMSKKKKQQKQAERRQEEVFGGQFQYQDEVADQYIDMEDQFM